MSFQLGRDRHCAQHWPGCLLFQKCRIKVLMLFCSLRLVSKLDYLSIILWFGDVHLQALLFILPWQKSLLPHSDMAVWHELQRNGWEWNWSDQTKGIVLPSLPLSIWSPLWEKHSALCAHSSPDLIFIGSDMCNVYSFRSHTHTCMQPM